jgi:lysozyme
VTPAQKAGAGIAALFVACAAAAPALIQDEGWRTTTYSDSVGVKTACGGVTGPAVIAGKVYTETECQGMTAAAALKIAIAIQPCAPGDLPSRMRQAFIRFSYNEGAGAFCASGISRAVKAGDLVAACRRINQGDDGRPQYIYAGRKTVCDHGKCTTVPISWPGLIKRRAEERALCEQGLKELPK